MHWQTNSCSLEMMLSSALEICQHASVQQRSSGRSTPHARLCRMHATSEMRVGHVHGWMNAYMGPPILRECCSGVRNALHPWHG